MYIRKDAGLARETEQGTRVILDLAEDIDNSCHNITCDNFFTNLSLAQKLLQKKLTLIGTMRKSKPELPTEFAVAKGRNVKSTVFGFQLDAMIASYCSKTNRVVNMLSTMHSQPEIENTSDQKPSIILFYNKTKDGVDTLDRMVRSHSTKRKTRRWPLDLFYNVIDVSTINAFIIWQGIYPENGNIYMRQRRKFLISLGRELCEITEEAQPVAPVSETRKRKVTLAGNGASSNKRARGTLYDRKAD